jgi:spore coat polysaccharide biosynthesis protein SpsF
MFEGKRISLIVQARFGSTRLPGKVLEKIGGESALKHNLYRCTKVHLIDDLCCAIPDSPVNNPIAEEAKCCGATVIRGSEDDVLSRYHKAAVHLGSDIIVRVTSDCPFLDPDVVTKTLELFLNNACTFACNNAPPTWPHGFDCEVTSFAWLDKAFRQAKDPFDREHVMPFVRNHPEIKIANFPSDQPHLKAHRWTLDYPEDLRFFQMVARYLPHPLEATTQDILTVLHEHPEITAINAAFHESSRK